jgi:hypothetical protein
MGNHNGKQASNWPSDSLCASGYQHVSSKPSKAGLPDQTCHNTTSRASAVFTVFGRIKLQIALHRRAWATARRACRGRRTIRSLFTRRAARYALEGRQGSILQGGMAVTHLGAMGLRAAVCLALAVAVSAVVSLDEPFSTTTSNVFSLYPQLGLNGGPCELRQRRCSRAHAGARARSSSSGTDFGAVHRRFSPANERH